MKSKEIERCIRIMTNIASSYAGNVEDQLYIFTKCFIQLAQKGKDEQDIMRKCRAAVGCLIGALVPHEYFESFMEDIGLLEDDIYNEELLQEVQDECDS